MVPVEQPSGTVSLLFSDVEGSTQLLTRLGAERYGLVLARQRELLRAAFAAQHGYEVDCEGDSFFVAFTSSAAALAAAAAAQRALAAEPWPDGESVRVRIGVHTGEPLLAAPKYVGLDVHQAARVMQAGHGGQVLISEATRALVERNLPDGVTLRDLGEHRLRDLARSQRLTQLVIDGVPAEFPALRTLEHRPLNLPVQATTFVGRGAAVAAVVERLRRPELRLLTLTGPGGSGKTRLALQAAAELADEFAQGVHFVALAPLDDRTHVLPTIARTLGLAESGSLRLEGSLRRYLGEQQLLLLLDNFEHLVEAAPDVGELLSASPNLRLLVTSRIPLRLAGEHEYAVPPLALPDPARLPEAAVLAGCEAVALFAERARSVRADFELTDENAQAVAELCVRLDGLPLAIELAAARVKLLPPRTLLARLEQRLDLLTGPRDLPERQQTLRATIDWSHDLLGPAERRLFARLAVFQGGCTLDAAEAVCGADGLIAGLATLVDTSMLRQQEQGDGEPRFAMLETIRAYALERLEASGQWDEVRHRHARWFAVVDERMPLNGRSGGVDWLCVDLDIDNFRAALRELADHDAGLFVRLVWNLRFFWYTHYSLREGADWSATATRVAGDLSASDRARAWQSEATFAFLTLDHERASELYRLAFDAWRADDPEEAIERAWIVYRLSEIASMQGDYDQADSLSEQAAAMLGEIGDAHGMFVVAHSRALSVMRRGDYDSARALLDEAVRRGRGLAEEWDLSSALLDVGILELRGSSDAEAVAAFAETLERGLRRGNRVVVATSLRGLAAVGATRGQLESAARLVGSSDRLFEATGWPMEQYERDAFDERLAPLLERVDEPEIAAALAAGRAMSDAEAAAFALETVASPPRANAR